MAVPLGREYLRNLRVAAGLLALACLAATAFFVLEVSKRRTERPLLRIAEIPTGALLWQPSIYAYNEAKSAIFCEADQAGERTLRLKLDDSDGKTYLGVGFSGPFHVPEDAELVLDWKRHGSSPGLEFHVVDAEPGRVGEVFSAIIPLIGEDWTVSRIPLSAFTRNTFQDKSRPSDGKLNPDGIQAVELGFPVGTRMDVVIRSIAFVWGERLGASLFALPLLVGAGLFLIFRSFSLATLKAPVQRLASSGLTNRYVLAAVIAALLLTITRSARRAVAPLDLVLSACVVAIVLLDEVWSHPLEGRPAWTWRFMVPLIAAVLAGWAPTPVPYGLICAAAVAPALERHAWHRLAVFSFLVLGLVGAMRPLAVDVRLPHLASASVVVLLLFVLTLYLRGREQVQITARTLQLYDGIFHDSSEGIYTLDARGTITSVNPGFERLLGRPASELVGSKLDGYLVEEDRERFSGARAADGDHASVDLRFVDATGRARYTLTRIQPLSGESTTGFQAVSTDISERRLLEEELLKGNRELQALSERDDLTALSNRRCFDRHLGQEFARARRSHTPLALILCDIDYFKGYNDRVGHQGGDDVLRAVALLLSGFARRAGEMAARYGGDEFALILPTMDAESLAFIGERLRAAVETAELPHPESAVSPFLTLSIGAASVQPSADCTPEDLIATADRALYQAKERGRNRVAVLVDMVRTAGPREGA
jgi:diguanylate cyclase (GGDEF)-like protein/PAS domain S-box-containing protein